jgi:hypothetical protein
LYPYINVASSIKFWLEFGHVRKVRVEGVEGVVQGDEFLAFYAHIIYAVDLKTRRDFLFKI